jgi:hypothetical protein
MARLIARRFRSHDAGLDAGVVVSTVRCMLA